MHHLHTVFIVGSSPTVTTIINTYSMNCYELLDIPNYKIISDKFYNFLINRTDFLYRASNSDYPMKWEFLNVEMIQPYISELFEYLKNNDIEIAFLAVIGLKPISRVVPHVDTTNKELSKRILWPINNCDHSIIYFYDVDKKYYKKQRSDTWISDTEIPDSSDKSYYDIEGGPHMIIDQVALTQPIIIDTSIPHSVINITYDSYTCFTIQPNTSLEKCKYK